MALDCGGKESEIKEQFTTREGIYKQIPDSKYCRPNRIQHPAQGSPSAYNPVKASFAEIQNNDKIHTRIVFTIGRDLYYFNYEGISQPLDLTKPLDKRTYKGVAPTCHDVNKYNASIESVLVAVGFAAGQVQIIDVGTKQSLRILNEERMVEKVSTTCVKWVPDAKSLLISSHANGHMYTYNASEENINVVPQYHEKPHKVSNGVSIYALKSKSYTSSNGQSLGVLKNPCFKWIVTNDNSAIHEFKFSPDGKHIAIVSQDGYLRVIEYSTFEMQGSMKSYFGGLLCCCWSPDGKYIVTGGEDDLVTVWSFYGEFVLARGHGHHSWVSNVAFDMYCCVIPEEDEIINWYEGDSPALSSEMKLVLNAKQDIGRKLNAQKKLHRNEEEGMKKSYAHHLGRKDILSRGQDLDSDRQRTYSNVSRLSRISLSGSIDASPCISYRFGSVGQDARLCLWELTDEILFPRSRAAMMLGGFASVHGKEKSVIMSSHFFKPSHCLAKDNDSSNVTKENLQTGVATNSEISSNNIDKRKHKKTNSRTSLMSSVKDSSGHNLGLGHFFTSKTSKLEATSGKSAPNAISDTKQEPKLNPDFHLSNNHVRKSGSSVRQILHGKKHQSINNCGDTASHQHHSKTLGTFLCPRLDETAMLEPLVCKRITQGQLTCISFQKDSIVTACQDGFIQTWGRPQQYVRMASSSPYPPSIVQSHSAEKLPST